LLRTLQQAEMEWMVADKVGGRYHGKPALYDHPFTRPEQTVRELVRLSYLEPVAEMNNPILTPYRTKL
jgi:hypothetical protein